MVSSIQRPVPMKYGVSRMAWTRAANVVHAPSADQHVRADSLLDGGSRLLSVADVQAANNGDQQA
ncbi:MAG: hypothetical protein R3C19_07880 [Planctomycetaceae bacterium]